ncbi:MAG: c-type cytochrome [Gemmatimonadetes bacterium]|nr:c-type cytochrome [Gemmatimonadota bacterium]
MKKVLKVIGILLGLVVLAAGAFYLWAGSAANSKLATSYTVHAVDFPVPFPLDSAEVRKMRLRPEAAAKLAGERALERGEHLVESRYGCLECHGGGFSGGVMVDAAPIGRLFGPNLTTGKGSRTLEYHVADWDRIVRHGVRKDGLPAIMPSGDFEMMSDQELSDIIHYIRSFPPADNEVPPRTLGPVGKVLVATGKIVLSATVLDPQAAHAAMPPAAAVTLEFGKHMATTCTGCHSRDLAGGPIQGGDPAWPPARNLTPTGLAGWTYEQFLGAMREAKRPDGTMLKEPMAGMPKFANKMTDVELQALWMYLKSVPGVASR